VYALIRRCRHEQGGAAVNVKRVYRIMKAHGLLLERHTGNGVERRHDSRVAVDRPHTRWCSDGLRSAATMVNGSGSPSRWVTGVALVGAAGDLLRVRRLSSHWLA
jgi:transposase InsO family protein